MGHTNESKISYYGKFEFKEDEGEFYSKGFVATTHPDRASEGSKKGDILTKGAISSIVEQINSRKGMLADYASYRHDWIKEKNPELPIVGRAIEAEVRELPNGHFGAWVETHHNKTHPQFENIKYEVQNGYLPGYSIEFVAGDSSEVNLPDGTYRMVDELDLKGFGLANGRLIANPQAMIADFGYKEIIEAKDKNKKNETKEVHKMSEDEIKQPEVNAPAEEKKEELVKEEPKVEEKKEEIDAKELADFKKFKEMQVKEKKSAEFKEMFQSALKEVMPEMKVPSNDIEVKEAHGSIEFKEWKEMVSDEKISVKEAFYRATKLAEKNGAIQRWGYGKTAFASNMDFKTSGIYGERIEMKALETDTNKSSDTDYLQSAAELSDIYAPAITKMLNLKTTFYGLIPKESWAGRESISWRAENVANASGGFYFEGGAITKGNTTRQKLREEFKYFSIGVQVTGQMIESAKSGVGDIYQIELEAATRKALSQMNAALFAEKGAFTDEEFLGLEYVADSTGNTVLYGLTRSATNLLGASGSEYNATSSAPISKAYLRTAVRTLEVNGADRNTLIYVCNPVQRDLILSLLDDAQRFASTMPRAGFEGMPTFDGIPIHADKDCNNDDVYCVSFSPDYGVAMAVQKPLTYEDLAKSDDSKSGFLKFYGNMYVKAPKKAVYMLQGLATS